MGCFFYSLIVTQRSIGFSPVSRMMVISGCSMIVRDVGINKLVP